MERTNDTCEVCHEHDAAILDDAAKRYCPRCWLARCESKTTDRRARPRDGSLVEQLRDVRKRLHYLDEPGTIAHADALVLAGIVARVVDAIESATREAHVSALRDALESAATSPRASVAAPEPAPASGDSTAPEKRSWFPRPWGVAGRDERESESDASAFGLDLAGGLA